MTQTTTQNPVIITASGLAQNATVAKFLQDNERYFKGQAYKSQEDLIIDINPDTARDNDKLKEFRQIATKAGFIFSMAPPSIRFPHAALTVQEGYTLHFRRREDFEQGGPQPRIWILDDPELKALADNIELHGQKEPIDASPSPDGTEKLWVIEGHGRFTSIFEILARRDPQKWVGIWTKEKKRSKLECFEDSVILNGKKKLTAYELGAFIMRLPQELPEIYAPKIHGFNFQETVGKRLGLDNTRVSQILIAFNEITAVSKQVGPQFVDPVKNLPERTVREIKNVPAEVKTEVFKQVVEKDLSASEAKTVAAAVKETPTAEKVTEAVNRVVENREKTAEERAAEAEAERMKRIEAQAEEARKAENSVERRRAKLQAAAEDLPENVVNFILGHKGKDIRPEEVSAYGLRLIETVNQRRLAEREFVAKMMQNSLDSGELKEIAEQLDAQPDF